MVFSNFFLMLKQGIKGVFKFKIQFAIIVLLSFVATFILSIALSTQDRLQDSYNKIVKPVDKFSYSGTVRINSTADATNDYLLLPNLISDMGTSSIKIIDDENNASEKGAYNYVYNNFDGHYLDNDKKVYKSFLTEGTAEFIQQVKDKNLQLNAFAGSTNAQNGSSMLFHIYINKLFGELKIISNLKNENVKLGEISSNQKMNGSMTVYSPVGLYTYNHPFWFSKFVKFNGDDVELMTNPNDVNWNTYIAIVYAVAHITNLLSQNVNKFNTESNIEMPVDSSQPNSGDCPKPLYKIDNNEKAIAYLFGENVTGKNDTDINDGKILPKDNEWLVKNDYSNIYTINASLNAKNATDYNYVFATPGDDKLKDKLSSAIFHSGLRGISSPIINVDTTFDKAVKNNFTGVTSWNWYKNIDLLHNSSDGNSLFNRMDFGHAGLFDRDILYVDNMLKIANGMGSDSWDQIWVKAAWAGYNSVISGAAGFRYGMREEVTNFDPTSQISFRSIIIQQPEENYNFQILEGSMPTKPQEIAINEQYAKENHIKVGMTIKIINTFKTVKAIASDAFSYMPGSDLNMPIPSPKTSAFIYGTRESLNEIHDENATGSKTNTAQIFDTLCYFLWDELDSSKTLNLRKKAWYALDANSDKEIIENYNAIKQYVNEGAIDGSTKSSTMSLSSFDDSLFRYSWTVLPSVLKIYDSIVYVASAVIALIAIIALIISVKKTIEFNSKQIGILKALGESSGAVSVSYLSHSLIVGFIVVPIAWILGIVGQLAFAGLFAKWFTIIPNVITFDWISLVISFGVLGVLSCLVAFFSALMLNKKPIISILYSSIKWGRLKLLEMFKDKVLSKSPFSVRFSLTLTSSGSKQITLMTLVMFIASVLIGVSIALPAIVVKINSSYYAAVKYSNQFNDVPLIGNTPLTKNAVSYWDGQDYADSQFDITKSIIKDGYYKDQSVYNSTINNSSAFSPYMYDKKTDEVVNSYVYLLNHFNDLVSNVSYLIGNNMSTVEGVGLSAGAIDGFYGAILHSLDGIKINDNSNALAFNNEKTYSDDDRESDIAKISDSLTNQFSSILGTLIGRLTGSSTPSGNDDFEGDTWKDKLLGVIYTRIPSYIRNYVEKSKSRQDQFAFSFQNEVFIPGEETLATKIVNDSQATSKGKQSIELTGLDRYQNSIIISNKNKDRIYLPDDLKQKIYDVLNVPVDDEQNTNDAWNTDIKSDKFGKIYDGKTHTLFIPTLANMQAESAYNFGSGKVLNGWNNNMALLQFNSNGSLYDLPADAWVYDDTDYAKYILNSKLKGNSETVPYANEESEYSSDEPNKYWIWTQSNGKYYIDASKVDNGKLTFAKQFDDGDDISDKALLFKEFKYGKDGKPNGTFIRPLYQYKNFRLMMPLAWVNEDKVLWSDSDKYSHTKYGTETKGWYDDTVSYDNVPDSVKDAYQRLSLNNEKLSWNDAKQSKWLVINPYDVRYYFGDKSDADTPLSYLTDKITYWYRYFRNGDSQFNVAMNTSLKDYLASLGANKNINIALKSVGQINSYNNKLLVADSDLVNMLAGYKNTRAYQYNNQLFDESKVVRANETSGKILNDDGTVDENAKTTSEFDRYKLKDTNTSNFYYNDWSSNDVQTKNNDLWQPKYYKLKQGESILNYAPHSYFNTKLSNIDEPLDVTSSVSFTTLQRLGQLSLSSLGTVSDGNERSIVNSQELLSTIRALTSQVTNLAISIGLMLTVAIIITSALLIMLTGDIYISQYKRFMILLRALGYSNAKISMYTFGTVTVFSGAAWLLGTIIAWVMIFAAVQIIWAAGFAIPVGINWWPVLLSLLILGASYVGSLYVSSMKARKLNPSEVLTETAE